MIGIVDSVVFRCCFIKWRIVFVFEFIVLLIFFLWIDSNREKGFVREYFMLFIVIEMKVVFLKCIIYWYFNYGLFWVILFRSWYGSSIIESGKFFCKILMTTGCIVYWIFAEWCLFRLIRCCIRICVWSSIECFNLIFFILCGIVIELLGLGCYLWFRLFLGIR